MSGSVSSRFTIDYNYFWQYFIEMINISDTFAGVDCVPKGKNSINQLFFVPWLDDSSDELL